MLYCAHVKWYLWVPQFTGYAQVLAASHQSVGLGRLTRLPVTQVSSRVEGVLSYGLGHKSPQAIEGILSCYQLSTLVTVLKVEGLTPGHERPSPWTKGLVEDTPVLDLR